MICCSYNAKGHRQHIKMWCKKNALRIGSLTVRQWLRFEPELRNRYPVLWSRFMALYSRWMKLSDMLKHDGHCNSMRVDKYAQNQYTMKAIKNMKLQCDRSQKTFGPAHVEFYIYSIFIAYLLHIYCMFIICVAVCGAREVVGNEDF